ncbi:3'-5' exonuclease [Aquimarina litoralis]|uniref:3'-5' exonuclease n=1 Tax=Aquimarina litoralis TaxID=584605 RepID=UPI001C58E55A|nr:3'-5' exonuclease [Aquimarina litoralis]MBW1296163.1 3'-5' exonuclease [Aquimarina litoralis]
MNFWFSNNNKNDLPDFWKEYINCFENKQRKKAIESVRFIAFDTETTGFDYKNDRVLSIGAIAIKDMAIDVSDQLELYLEQDVFNSETVEIHGIRKNHDFTRVSEGEAIELFLKYIGNAVLIAHHADFDRRMINSALQRNGLGNLKNRFLDTGILFGKTKHIIYSRERKYNHYTLDELCDDMKISKSDRHTASGDAFITALAFLKIIPKLQIKRTDSSSILF